MADRDTNELLADILDELREIRRVHVLMAKPFLRRAVAHLQKTHLTTEERREMYRLADGTRTLADIAGQVGKTHEAVRKLMVDLASEGYVHMVKHGNVYKPRRLV